MTRIRFRYINHRGEVAIREVFPTALRWGETEWHPTAQWLLVADDCERKATREFALKDCDFSTTELTLAVNDPLARGIVREEILRALGVGDDPNAQLDSLVTWHLAFVASGAWNNDILADVAGGDAFNALKNNQRQLDADGIEVGVSRQALDEVLESYRHLIWRRDDLLTANNRYLERARAAEAPMDRVELAKAIYAAQGHEECDPWDAAVARAERLGILQDNPGFLNSNQQTAMAAADAAIAFRAAR